MWQRAVWEGEGRGWRQETQGQGEREAWKKLGASEAGGRGRWVQLRIKEDTVGYGEGLGFRESGLAGKQQPGPRMGEGGDSQDIEPF